MFAPTAITMMAMQILATIGFIASFWLLTPLQFLFGVLGYVFIATIGPVVTYHRLLSHKSFKSPKWFEYFGSVVGCLGFIASPLAWVATHRQHHRFTDTEKDPHSPYFEPWWKVQFFSMFHPVSLKYVPDLLRSRFHVELHKSYWIVNFIYLGVLFALGGYAAVLYGYCIPTFLVWHAGSAINTINHLVGYRTHNTKDGSTNNFWTGWLVSGEGWHNNHHAAPMDPQFGKRWYEFDLGYQLIRLVRRGS